MSTASSSRSLFDAVWGHLLIQAHTTTAALRARDQQAGMYAHLWQALAHSDPEPCLARVGPSAGAGVKLRQSRRPPFAHKLQATFHIHRSTPNHMILIACPSALQS